MSRTPQEDKASGKAVKVRLNPRLAGAIDAHQSHGHSFTHDEPVEVSAAEWEELRGEKVRVAGGEIGALVEDKST